MNRKNAIQERFEIEINKVAAKFPGAHVTSEAKGDRELYLLIRINSLELYVYNDGEAQIKGATSNSSQRLDIRYELAAFDNLDDLRSTFLEKLEKLIQSSSETL